jgi:hypothetical protein
MLREKIRLGKSVPITSLMQIAFPTHTSVIEEVPCALLKESDSSPEVDTDNEEEASLERKGNTVNDNKELNELAIAKNTKPYKYNRSRHAPGGQGQSVTYDPCNNYVKEEVDLDKLRLQLSSDAFDIVGSEPNDQTKKSTTCLCVALRDEHKYVKKFVFHNEAHVMSPAMRKKAYELGYDVTQAEQSHAELQFTQFLIRREQVRPGLYTHIMGMGCSRRYCAECDHLLKGIVSDEYLGVASSVDHEKSNSAGPRPGFISATSNPIHSDEADSSDAVKFTQTIAQEIEYEVVKGKKAVDDASYDNYYLPENLQEEIRRRTGLNLDFSNERFNKKKSNRKRAGSKNTIS